MAIETKGKILGRNFHPPVASTEPYMPTFDRDRLNRVIGIIRQPEIQEAMQKVNPHIPAETIAKGEDGRLSLLSGAFHPSFYHESLRRLMACRVIQPGYSMVELGPSMGGHYPLIPHDLQPNSVLGLDNQPHIVAAAEAAVKLFQKSGLLDARNYKFMVGDHNSIGVMGDVSILSLASQYDSGEEGAVRWLMEHCLVAGINGDVVHSPIEIFPEEIDQGILPIRSPRLPKFGGYTGVNWKLEGSPKNTFFGDVYQASLLLDDVIYNPDNGIEQVPQRGAELLGKVTILKRGQRMFVEPWAWELTDQATEREMQELQIIRTTFNELYSQLGQATNNQRVWESTSALGVPVYAAEAGYSSVVMLNTATQVAKRSGMLPLAILMRNGDELRLLEKEGLLSQIGSDKPVPNLGELNKIIGGYLSNPQRFQEIVDYTNPLLVTSITTRRRDIFDSLRKAA